MDQLDRELERCTEASCGDRPQVARPAGAPPPPPDRNEIGQAGWHFLHTLAARHPAAPSDEERLVSKAWMWAFTRLYPCHICRLGFEKILKDSQPRTESRDSYAMWMCEVHNAVNEDIGAPTRPCVLEELLKMGITST
ncbi:unnamed protein product [Vitrella brassicaformis CCMP3155]|uniref:Sulfhydryl oxidase n=2 Tax=Vitrella brassicaformis TaxID=1169539 RepID=A0A0G4ER46_VITBC|nr:unnamed protein product [Vitrella brassicaformis CCMP3155]|mmetsp:Transcript_52302/g.131450  ORF Transcript_52302/g.131450 Transcript_52302/m.131450 type:complete len:138 (+) Transcript_52302:83-496(+)|eukprot:CEM00046.1 unnamed protein product [Vitrella brassicaformis CCMP3155]